MFHYSLEAIQTLMQTPCETAFLQNEVMIKNTSQVDQEIFDGFYFFIHG